MIYYRAVATVIWSLFIWWLFVLPKWPWDWKGTRKDITLQTRRHDWDDDE